MQPEAIALIKKIEKSVEVQNQRKKGRSHLGASVLGRECLRQIWYGWRWVHVPAHRGRLLRLWNRGHREEAAFTAFLRGIGLTVQEHSQRLVYHAGSDSYALIDWDREWSSEGLDDVSDQPLHHERAALFGVVANQWGFSAHGGHFGGSADGKLFGEIPLPFEADGPGLLEFKTHNEKSFTHLAGKLEEWRSYMVDPETRTFTGKGLLSSKLEHYIQMQVYMKYLGLEWGLYLAVCKNTDDLYFEFVRAKPEVGDAYSDRAFDIIHAQFPPNRITQDPSWWKCKFCDYREICFHDKVPQKNCRSCMFACPIENGEWLCEKYHQSIPQDYMPHGCDKWEAIST